MQLLEQMAALKRENEELVKQAEEAKDEISIVSQSRSDGTQPETLPPHGVSQQPSKLEGPTLSPDEQSETVEVPPSEAAAEQSEAVPVDTPQTEPVSEPVAQPVPADVPEDSLPEVEPEPPSRVPGDDFIVPRSRKSGFLWKFILFLIIAGGAFFAAWHFFPEYFDFLKFGSDETEVVEPEPEPEPVPEPVPEEPAEAESDLEPEAIPETKPEEPPPPEEPEEKAAKKKRVKKRKPKKTAKVVVEDKMSVGEAKRQIRRLIASKDLGGAQKMLAEWVKKRPRDAGLHYLYGRLYLLQGKKNEAADRLERAIELAPRMASAYHDLGAVYLQMGDNESACDALGEFVRLKPDHSRTPAIQALMKKIKCP